MTREDVIVEITVIHDQILLAYNEYIIDLNKYLQVPGRQMPGTAFVELLQKFKAVMRNEKLIYIVDNIIKKIQANYDISNEIARLVELKNAVTLIDSYR